MKRLFAFTLVCLLTCSFSGCDDIWDLIGGDNSTEQPEDGADKPSDDTDDGEGEWEEVLPQPEGPVSVTEYRITTIFHLVVAQGDLEDDYADKEYLFLYDRNNRICEMALKDYTEDNDLDSISVVTYTYNPQSIVCQVDESRGAEEKNRKLSTRTIVAQLDEYGNVSTIENKQFDLDGTLIDHEMEWLTYSHYGAAGRELEECRVCDIGLPSDGEPYVGEYIHKHGCEFSTGHHVWSGYPAYTNTWMSFGDAEGYPNKTNLDLNWVLWNCSHALSNSVCGLNALHPFLLLGLCGDASSECLTTSLTSAPNNGVHLYYRYKYQFNNDLGVGYPQIVRRYVTDDPSRDGNYKLESEFWIVYEPYTVIVGKE
jgi:hypothetical protein